MASEADITSTLRRSARPLTQSRAAPVIPRQTTKALKTNATTRATATATLEAPEYQLRIAIDYGSVNLSAAYHLKHSGDSSDEAPQSEGTVKIHDINFAADNPQAPMRLYWDTAQVKQEARLMWGHDLRQLIDDNFPRIARDHIIEIPKLALYRRGVNQQEQALLDRQLKRIAASLDQQNFTLQDFLAYHLEMIMSHIMDEVAGSLEAVLLKQRSIDIRMIDKQVYLSVPQAWSPESTDIMAAAARSAGIKKGQLVLEPQCVAAYAMCQEIDRRDELNAVDLPIEGEYQQLVVDAGGGTIDLVKYEIVQRKGTGANSQLKTIRYPKGEVLLEEDLRARKNPEETLDDILRSASISVENWRRQTYDTFEKYKTSDNIDPEHNTFIYRGRSGVRPHTFLLDGKLMHEAIDWGIERVLDLIQPFMMPQTRSITLSGGFGNSERLSKALQLEYEDDDVNVLRTRAPNGRTCLAVTHGALYRHEQVELLGVPTRYCYFMVQYMEFHPDSVIPLLSSTTINSAKATSWKIVIVLLAKKGEISVDEKPITVLKLSEWYSDAERPMIGARLCWAKENVTADAALSQYRQGVDYQEWKNITLELTQERMSERGYKAVSSDTPGQPDVLKLFGRVVLKASGAHINVGFQIAQANRIGRVRNLVGPTFTYLLDQYEEDCFDAGFSSVPADLYQPTDGIERPQSAYMDAKSNKSNEEVNIEDSQHPASRRRSLHPASQMTIEDDEYFEETQLEHGDRVGSTEASAILLTSVGQRRRRAPQDVIDTALAKTTPGCHAQQDDEQDAEEDDAGSAGISTSRLNLLRHLFIESTWTGKKPGKPTGELDSRANGEEALLQAINKWTSELDHDPYDLVELKAGIKDLLKEAVLFMNSNM